MRVHGLRLASTALVTILTAAIAVVGSQSTADAVGLVITGGAQDTLGFAGYGSGNNENNVVNANNGAGVIDACAWVNNYGKYYAGATSALAVTGSTVLGWTIEWTYIGSESGNVNQFSVTGSPNFVSPIAAEAAPAITGQIQPTAVGGVLTHYENELNNNYLPSGPPNGRQYLGFTTGTGDGNVAFSFQNLNRPLDPALVNGANNDTNVNDKPSMIFAYLAATAGIDPFGQQILETIPSADGSIYVLIGLNDAGSSDDNHDDYMLMAIISEGQRQTDVPIPAALPLMGSALAAGFLFVRRRRRKNAAAAA